MGQRVGCNWIGTKLTHTCKALSFLVHLLNVDFLEDTSPHHTHTPKSQSVRMLLRKMERSYEENAEGNKGEKEGLMLRAGREGTLPAFLPLD